MLSSVDFPRPDARRPTPEQNDELTGLQFKVDSRSA
jgi:hypothetical protein